MSKALGMHDDLGLLPCQARQPAPIISVLGGGDRRIPKVCWPAGVTLNQCALISVRDCLIKQGGETEKDIDADL